MARIPILKFLEQDVRFLQLTHLKGCITSMHVDVKLILMFEYDVLSNFTETNVGKYLYLGKTCIRRGVTPKTYDLLSSDFARGIYSSVVLLSIVSP